MLLDKKQRAMEKAGETEETVGVIKKIKLMGDGSRRLTVEYTVDNITRTLRENVIFTSRNDASPELPPRNYVRVKDAKEGDKVRVLFFTREPAMAHLAPDPLVVEVDLADTQGERKSKNA